MKKAEMKELRKVKTEFYQYAVSCEIRYAKHSRNDFVKKCFLKADPQFENKVARLADEIEVPPKTVERTVIAAVLHQNQQWHSVDAATLFGIFANSLDWAEDSDPKFEKFLGSNNNPWLGWKHGVSKEGNKFLCIRCFVQLSKEEIDALDNFQHVWPMPVMPDKVTPYSDGHLVVKEIPNSRKAGPNLGCACYDLDRMNRVAFAFDEYVWNFKYLFEVKKFEDTEEGRSRFMQAVSQAALKLKRLKTIIEEFKSHGVKQFHFTHFDDQRLRAYCKGWQANEQGDKVDKALLCFAQKKFLTKVGEDGLKIHIANSINPKVTVDGVTKRLDKFDFETRIKWVTDHDSELEALAAKTYEKAEFPEGFRTQYAAEDAYAAAGAIHWLREHQKGNPVPAIVHFDAVNQGLQLQAIMTSDDKIMRQTCVIGQERLDFYLWGCKKLGWPEEYRPLFKDGMKPAMYGGTQAVIDLWGLEMYQKFVSLTYTENLKTFQLIRQFPTQYKENWTEICWTLPDGARTKVLPKKKFPWTAHIFGYEFTGTFEKFGVPNNRVCSLGPNIIHSIDGFIKREMCSRCDFDPDAKELVKQYLAHPWKDVWDFEPREKDLELKRVLELGKEFNYYSFHILDLLDEHNIYTVPRDVLELFDRELPEDDFHLTCIHDSFGCHPNYWIDLTQQYRYCLYHLGKSNMLQHIAKELDITLDIPHKNEYLMDEILNGKFALC